MAPTTLMGQRTATSPSGRDRLMGEPLRMAEMVAGLQGPVYVERVALYDAKRRVQAEKAIRRALETQVQGRGFAFVEVLAECPTHLHMTPIESERWVKEAMLPVFPLGVKKDVSSEPWFHPRTPQFDPEAVCAAVGGGTEASPRFCRGFPAAFRGHDIAFKLAGAGGDGAQTAAMLLTRAAIAEGFDATHIPSYGPESRGGTSYADVRIAEGEVLSPAVRTPDALVAFNAPSLAKFGPTVARGGTIVYDSSVATPPPDLEGVKLVGVPCSQIAVSLGAAMVKNIVALGALQAATAIFPEETLLTAIRSALRDKRSSLVPVNEAAFREGVRAAGA
jgi:2-oxoisovalerate ferredoxin oxidoreductase beta subunit